MVGVDSNMIVDKYFSNTISMRGVTSFLLDISMFKFSQNSNEVGGIYADPMRVARDVLLSFEDSNTGLLPLSLHTDVPSDKYAMYEKVIQELGPDVFKALPILPKVSLMESDQLSLYLQNVWKPQCTVLGIDGIPTLNNSSSTIRKSVTLKLSVRTPPNLSSDDAIKSIQDTFQKIQPLYNA